MPSTMTANEIRRARLSAAIGNAEVHSEETRKMLADAAPCLRYALQTAEPSYGDNPMWTVHATLDEVGEDIAGQLQDEYPWWPGQIIDLDTDKDLIGGMTITHAVTFEEHSPECRRIEGAEGANQYDRDRCARCRREAP